MARCSDVLLDSIPVEELEFSDYGRTGPNLMALIPAVAAIAILAFVSFATWFVVSLVQTWAVIK
jgi:hypothetical protein